ncbi:MAG: thiamine phosphate synthase [Treponema sp.]|nr:thiamine phosphate synthase [Treponema sp.]
MKLDKFGLKSGLKSALALYAVTDRYWTGEKSLAEQVEECLEGGATMVQLREKSLDYSEFKKEGEEFKKLCSKYKVPFLINDNVLLAKEVDADGVHIGQSDMELIEARKILGREKIIGVSAQTVEQALLAEKNGADYLGVGAVFHTDTKNDADDVPYETLKAICTSVKIPVVAIGGITLENMVQLKDSGICGIAVVSAIFGKKDIRLASSQLMQKVRECLLC